MEFVLKDQSVQFTFAGEKYSNGKKNRILKNVKKQDDGIKSARLISYSDIQA